METLKSNPFCYKLADTHIKNNCGLDLLVGPGFNAPFAMRGMTDALKSVRHGVNHFSDKTNLSCAFHQCESKASVLGALRKSDVKTSLLLNVQHSTLIKTRLSLLLFLYAGEAENKTSIRSSFRSALRAYDISDRHSSEPWSCRGNKVLWSFKKFVCQCQSVNIPCLSVQYKMLLISIFLLRLSHSFQLRQKCAYCCNKKCLIMDSILKINAT